MVRAKDGFAACAAAAAAPAAGAPIDGDGAGVAVRCIGCAALGAVLVEGGAE
jgi:hypothetical protein